METENGDSFARAAAMLPERWRTPLLRLSAEARDSVHEIRLRLSAPLTLSCTDGEFYVTADGGRTSLHQPGLLLCGQDDLTECVRRLCDFSLHSHQEEWRQGFLTARGCRAGIGGEVVLDCGRPISMRGVRSVCLRVARPHPGCATGLVRRLTATGRVESAVLCGAPSGGKTSLLRDAARQLSVGTAGRRFRVAVVDERGELSLGDALAECDVLTGLPKTDGIARAVRCLSPDVVLFDEWSSAAEAEAVREAAACGVAVITSCHSPTLAALYRRPAARSLLADGGIKWAAELYGHERPGEIAHMVEVKRFCDEMDGTAVPRAHGDGRGGVVRGAPCVSGGFSGRSRAPDAAGGRTDSLLCRADTGLDACAV